MTDEKQSGVADGQSDLDETSGVTEAASDAAAPSQPAPAGEGAVAPEPASAAIEAAYRAAAAGSAATAAADPAPAPEATSSPQSAPVASVVAEAPRSGSTSIAWLAIILVIAVASGLFYMMLEVQRREAALLQRVQSLESQVGQGDSGFAQMGDNLRRQLELEIQGLQARQERAESDLQRALERQQQTLADIDARAGQVPAPSRSAAATPDLSAALSTQLAPLQQALREQGQTLDAQQSALREQNQALGATQSALREQQDALREQQQRINDLTVDDRESWQLAEVQYLLRLANQRMIMTGDTTSAEAMLRSADALLRELDDADLHDLRAAVTSDLAAVRAVPRLDIQGLYLRLDALIRQTDALVLFDLPQREKVEGAPLEGDWTMRLAEGYNLALEKLSQYIVVSRRDIPVEALMDPQYEGLVRQNMRMLLEQAQVAMLSGNERLFQQSLERASQWVSQFFKADEQAAVAMREELDSIRTERVTVDLPDLAVSMQALDAVMRLRLARSGN